MTRTEFRLTGDVTLEVPEERLGGPGWVDHLATGVGSSGMKLVKAYLSPGTRTVWHKHPRGQLLHVVSGALVVQERGGEARLYSSGETASCTPGQWHWHGAHPDRFTIQMAVVEADENGEDAEWGAALTDEEYRSGLAQAL